MRHGASLRTFLSRTQLGVGGSTSYLVLVYVGLISGFILFLLSRVFDAFGTNDSMQ